MKKNWRKLKKADEIKVLAANATEKKALSSTRRDPSPHN